MGVVFGLLAGIWSRVSWTGFTSVFSRIWFYLLLLVRKKVFLGLAFYTTYRVTLEQLLLAVNQKVSLVSVGSAFVSESIDKFLGVAPQLLNGLENLQSGEIVPGVISVWTGVAALYMMLYLWNSFRGRVQHTSVDEVETGLVLLVWALISALIHDPGVLIGIVNEVSDLAGLLAESLPGSSGSGSVNKTI